MQSRTWFRLVALSLCFLLALGFAVPAEAAKPPAATTITVTAVSARYADTTRLSAVLTTDKGAVAGRTVTFRVDGAVVGSAVTDSAGMSSLLYTVSLPAGTYTTEASFAGDATYQSVSGTAALTVARRTATINVGISSQLGGQPGTLSAQIVSEGDLTLAGPVRFTVQLQGVAIGEYTAPVNSDGIATATTDPLSDGEYTVIASIDSAYYTAQAATRTVSVYRPTASVVAPDTAGSYGDTISLESVLTAGGVPLAGKTVHYWVNGTSVGSAVTDAAGHSALPHALALPAGSYVVNAVFSTDAQAYGSQAKATLTVTQRPGTLQYSGGTQMAGQPATLSATVKSDGGDLTLAGPVTFTLQQNGTTVGTYTAPVNAAGVASVSTDPLAEGTYSVTATIGSAYYAVQPVTGTFSVERSQTVLVLTDMTGLYGDTVTLEAVLIMADGRPLAGKVVEYRVEGVFAGSTVTDPTGLSSVRYLLSSPAGAYIVTADFYGDSETYGVADWATLTVTRRPASLAYTGSAQGAGKPATLSARVMSDGGDLTLAGPVQFTLQQNGTMVGAYTASADAAGVAKVVTEPLAQGDYTVTVTINSPYYVAQPAAGTLSVVGLETVLTVDSATVQYSDTIWLRATLTTADGAPLAGKTVNFHVDGSFVMAATTDAAGVSLLPYQVNLPAGYYSIVATFDGDSETYPASGTASLWVAHEDASLVYIGATVADGGPLQLGAQVLEILDGYPGDITNAGAVTFTLYRQEDGTVVGIFTTPVDVSGNAWVMTPAMPVAAYTVTLSIRSDYYSAPDTVADIAAAGPTETAGP